MNRILALQRKLLDKSLDAFIVSDEINILYLTGFIGLSKEKESVLIIDKNNSYLIIPKIYELQSKMLCNFDGVILPTQKNIFEITTECTKKYKGQIGFESNSLTYKEYLFLKKKNKKLFASDNLVTDLRLVKDSIEIRNIQRAANISDKAFLEIIKYIKPGITEKELSRKLINLMEDFGSEGISFPPIVASGKNSSLPHHLSSDKKIDINEPILFDFGAKFHNYSSDMTRMVYIGKPNEKFINTYNLVRKAQEAVLEMAMPGLLAEDLHNTVIDVFKNKSSNFIHGTGHGVGLNIHERPFLRKNIKFKLEKGMIVTIEPGLYFENQFGIRIEDLGVFTKTGIEIISKSSKELIVIQ